MDDSRIGRVLRAIRHQKAWRQEDVARKAGVSQTVVSNVEIGAIGPLTIATFRKVVAAMGAEAVVSVRWRGADLDRLLDEGHAAIVGAVVEMLTKAGWEVHPEVSFSIYGERGSIDVLGWHAASRTLLVVEVKTELVSVEETIRKMDIKIRLAPEIVADRFGWQPAFRSHLLVLPETSTQRRRVERHAAVLDLAMPLRGRALRAWLAVPDRSIGGLLFLPGTTLAGPKHRALGRKRIRPTKAEAVERAKEAADLPDVAKYT
jgi:transcriptional regulator with XRE-family HTH domain